jgi:hypothetical protein
MALAVLKFEGAEGGGGGLRFRADIGKNRFYQYAVGGGEASTAGGLKMLAEPRHVSALAGPLDESALGRFSVEIPRELFDREHAHVQLMSFRNERREGPAVSDIVRVPLRVAPTGELPPLTFARNYDMSSQPRARKHNGHATALSAPPTVSVPFSYRERDLSSGMFLGSLVSLLPSILPGLGGLLGGLLAGGGAAPSSGGANTALRVGGAAPPDILQLLADPRTAELITRLLQGLAAPGGAQVSKAAGLTSATPARRNGNGNGRHKGNGNGNGNGHAARALSLRPEYSEAAALPAALLAALPALMPVLEKALNPETIKAILGAVDPSKLLGVITNSIKDIGGLAIQSHEQDLKHLEAINPGVGPPVDNLLAGMSLSASSDARPVRFKRTDAVKLKFDDVQTVTLGGRARIAYLLGRDISFPLSAETPRPMKGALVQLLVKCPKTLRVLHAQKQRVEGAFEGGPLPAVPRLAASDLSKLERGEEYLVCASLVWKRKDGEKLGASVSQLVTLVGEFSFDRVEESSELIPLDDVSRFRDYWHKVWEGDFEENRRRFAFDAKYYYAVEPERAAHARMETLVKYEGGDPGEGSARLKSGMILSPYALNALIPQISEHPTLSEAHLDALRTPDFAARCGQAARTQARLRGRPGTSAALWVYPEVKMQRVVLQKAARVNDSGHVLGLAEESAHFPLPALVHVIGAAT